MSGDVQAGYGTKSPAPATGVVGPFDGLDPCDPKDRAVLALGLSLLRLRYDLSDPLTAGLLCEAAESFGITPQELCDRVRELTPKGKTQRLAPPSIEGLFGQSSDNPLRGAARMSVPPPDTTRSEGDFV